MINSREVALMAAKEADDKKAREIVLMDLGKIALIADYFLICSGTSQTHVKAIAQAMVDQLDEQGVGLFRREGHLDGQWILLDYGGVVVHVFRQEVRAYYDLERLWGDAPRLYYPFDEGILLQKEE